ncbi:MAG: hypothetical protein QF404_05790 [Planctomycetota bacterium]|nr:hypothetical protein [Planctomycetota bacterium]MDP6938716.1 hypothetical protein [Planctomycetota bacterium]
MQPGPVRSKALCRALKSGAGDLEPERWAQLLTLSYESFLEELGLYAGQVARDLAEAMYGAAPATWSVLCLEGAARRTGDLGRAAEVLEGGMVLNTRADKLELRERRAIVAAGAGELPIELDWLGRALLQGGTDGLQMRARLALVMGERQRTKGLFRVLVDRSRGPSPSLGEPPPWALRGWGLALLPPGPESSVSPGGPAPQIQEYIRNPSIHRD